MWTLIGIIAALLTMFGFVPQIKKSMRDKSMSGVSIVFLLQFFFGAFLWVLYGFYLNDLIIIITNLVVFLSLSWLLCLFFKYSKN